MPVSEANVDRLVLSDVVWDGEPNRAAVEGERPPGRARGARITWRELRSIWRSDATDRVCGAAVRGAARQLRAGGLVVLYDDRRDQGDLLAAAQLATEAIVNAMVRQAGGLVSVAITPERALQLSLRSLPVRRRGGRTPCQRTPSMVSVEARTGVSTGISAADRARTVSILAHRASRAYDLVSPGHVFPLVAAAGGLHERGGRREAAVDLLRLAGLAPAGALCDILDREGELASGSELADLSRRLEIPLVAVTEVAQARCEHAWGGG